MPAHRIAFSLAWLAIGCAGTPGAHPYDVSVAQHQAAARSKDCLATVEARREAADHRAAAVAWVEAQERACAGLASQARTGTVSPLERHADIAGVAPLVETTGGKVRISRTTGAVVTLRAAPGMTAEWLQGVIDRHLAYTATFDVADMSSGPLVPRCAVVRVSSTGNGFAVAIRSDEDATAREILARARRLWAERTSRR